MRSKHLLKVPIKDDKQNSPLERWKKLKMEGRLVVGWWWRTQNIGEKVNKRDDLVRRLITTKASNRASVHGTKRPVTQTIDKEEMEKQINKGKEEKEKKIKEMEKTVDSHFQNHSEDDHKS